MVLRYERLPLHFLPRTERPLSFWIRRFPFTSQSISESPSKMRFALFLGNAIRSAGNRRRRRRGTAGITAAATASAPPPPATAREWSRSSAAESAATATDISAPPWGCVISAEEIPRRFTKPRGTINVRPAAPSLALSMRRRRRMSLSAALRCLAVLAVLAAVTNGARARLHSRKRCSGTRRRPSH